MREERRKGEKMKLLFDFLVEEQLKGDAGFKPLFFFTQVTTMTNDGAEEGGDDTGSRMLVAVKFLKGAGVSPHGHRDSQGEEGDGRGGRPPLAALFPSRVVRQLFEKM